MSTCALVNRSPRHRYFTDPALVALIDETLGAAQWGDPAGDPLSSCTARAAWHFDVRRGEDGLLLPWSGCCYVNPPYDDAASWLEKCARHSAAGHEVLSLVPCQPGSQYWSRVVWKWASCVVFIGRPKFSHPLEGDDDERGLKAGDLVTTQHPTDVAIVAFGIDVAKMVRIWSRAGVVVAPVGNELLGMSSGT